MASGLDGLMKTLIKAMGVDPAQMLEGMNQFIGHVYERLAEFDRRMLAQETKLEHIAVQTTEILRLLRNADEELRNNVVPFLTSDRERTGTEG